MLHPAATSSPPLGANVLIRPVRDDDGPALARLIAACFAEYEGCPYEPSEFPELVAPARHYAAKGAAFWVMLHNGTLVGSVAATPVPVHQACEISKFYLDAAHRGSGAALALMAKAQNDAIQLGLPGLVLWTDTRFTRAHRFYEKLGFLRQPVIRRLADVSLSWEYRYERRGPP
jgi:putative acetyltransferase